MEINVLVDQEFEGDVEADWLQNMAERVLIAEGRAADVEMGLVITSQERVRGLNRQYRGIDEPTDVLAFAMMSQKPDTAPFVTPPDGVLHLGEVIVSYPQAVIQAEEHQHSVKRELAILIIHGILHLLGYDHEELEMARRMRTRESQILSLIEKGEQ